VFTKLFRIKIKIRLKLKILLLGILSFFMKGKVTLIVATVMEI